MSMLDEGNRLLAANDPRKYFTLAEANRALVLVGKIAADVVAGYSRLVELQEAIEAAERSGDHRRVDDVRRRILSSVETLRSCGEELACVGVELQDWALCTVDFLCLAGGREVRLCWQRGEPRVSHWHEVEAGCKERRSVESLPICEILKA